MYSPNIPGIIPESIENQQLVEISRLGNEITIAGDFSDLNNLNRGSELEGTPFDGYGGGKFIAFDIDTGESDATTVKLNGFNITSEEVEYATNCGLGAGHFVYIIDPTLYDTQTLVFSKEGRENTTIIIECVDIH